MQWRWLAVALAGRTGYLALCRFDIQSDTALVLAVRHQRESGYH